MYRSQQIAVVRDVTVQAHWTFFFLPLAMMTWQYAVHNGASALLCLGVFGGLYLAFGLQALLQTWFAKSWGIGIRDITLLPLSVIVRLTWISEKPYYELGIHLVGIASRLLSAGFFLLLLKANAWPVEPATTSIESIDPALICNRLFWMSIVMLLIDCVPSFPTSVGFLFRASLALSAKRIRATEITAHVGTFCSLICIGVGCYWTNQLIAFLFLLLLAIYFLVWSQQELADVRYFQSMKRRSGKSDKSPAMVLPEDQVVDLECRPNVPNFTGFTFNPRTKLWIEWKNGEPIGANALIGP